MTYKWCITGICNVDHNDWLCNVNTVFQEFLEISKKYLCNVKNQELNGINSMAHYLTMYNQYFMDLNSNEWGASYGIQKDEFKLNNIFSYMYCGEMQKYLNTFTSCKLHV